MADSNNQPIYREPTLEERLASARRFERAVAQAQARVQAQQASPYMELPETTTDSFDELRDNSLYEQVKGGETENLWLDPRSE